MKLRATGTTDKRILHVMTGPHPYIWIGVVGEGWYGALTKRRDLRRLAHQILRAIGDE